MHKESKVNFVFFKIQPRKLRGNIYIHIIIYVIYVNWYNLEI